LKLSGLKKKKKRKRKTPACEKEVSGVATENVAIRVVKSPEFFKKKAWVIKPCSLSFLILAKKRKRNRKKRKPACKK